MDADMRKLDLKDWAALGELIGTIAVVVSLVFVIVSLKQNTDALQGVNDNVLFEQHGDMMNIVISDPSRAAILAKKRNDDQLTQVEAIRWERYQNNLLDIWVMAFVRHERGLLDDDHWQAWNVYFTDLFSNQAEQITRERWDELQYGFDPDFWRHVNEALFAD